MDLLSLEPPFFSCIEGILSVVEVVSSVIEDSLLGDDFAILLLDVLGDLGDDDIFQIIMLIVVLLEDFLVSVLLGFVVVGQDLLVSN